VSYYKKDRIPPTDRKHFCGINFSEDDFLDKNLATSRGTSSVGENLRTLRIAVATTGEYTNYHGSATDALAAVVTTINRVNLIYEIDLSVRFLIVADNDLIIFTDATTDPYNNNSAGNMLNTNTAVLNANIGNGNYDIGHVFATEGAGLAGLGVVCSGDKGEGVTGIDPPEGTTFDVDYVSHEIGHQLSAFHTFNNCNGPGGTPTGYEPGSGSTIMAYAGLCGASNVQFSSGDYFHGVSLDQMNNYLNTQGGCFEEIPTNNLPPSVTTRVGDFFIPILTPFELTAQATDPDGDELTYCWEQFNAGPVSTLGEPTGNAPSFRSFSPTEDSTRVFPKIANVINNVTSPLEVLPSYTRGFSFNVVVRDNNPGGGGSASTNLVFQASQAAGPFSVTSPNAPGIQWEGNQQVEITWDVANTDQSPVNCSHVDIMLYAGTEFSFHSILALNTPNDGSEFITVPDETLVFARIKIKAHDNIFFNVSNNHFLILEDPASTTEIGDSRQLSVFPNPANEELYLNLQNGEGIDEIFLFNALGQKLHHQRLTSSLGLQSINTQAFSDGVYLLRVQAGNKFYTKKVVLKH
ncbi:MAG: reprolysin-like metallopeptidase, partial [Saprospiraceae bacterium]